MDDTGDGKLLSDELEHTPVGDVVSVGSRASLPVSCGTCRGEKPMAVLS